MTESASFAELARFLSELTDSASRMASQFTEQHWREPYATGKWTRTEVLGHLVDSAAHNHQRFARALHSASIEAAGYDGGAQVAAQRYSIAPAGLLLDAWRAENRLLSWVIAQIPVDKDQTPCAIGAFRAITLRELAFDYVAHLEHHLRQIFGDAALPSSGMPWPPAGRWQ